MNKDNLIQFMKDIKKSQPDLTDEEASKLAAMALADSKPKSRMYYKIGASREMAGGKKVDPKARMSEKLKGSYEFFSKGEMKSTSTEPQTIADAKGLVEFQTDAISVMENAGRFPITIVRRGDSREEVKVQVDTMDGTAVAGEDYVPLHQVITIKSGESEAVVVMEVLNDDAWEPDEDFYVKLSYPATSTTCSDPSLKYKFGRNKILTITTLNDDEPGTFQFKQRNFFVKESCGEAALAVSRENGADGEVRIQWRTQDKTAISGKDFTGDDGVLVFLTGETSKDVTVQIVNDMSATGKEEYFEVEMYSISEGAKFGAVHVARVTIANDEEFQEILANMMELTNANLSELSLYQSSWSQQIKNSMTANGGELETATATDYWIHFCTFGLKTIFALAPPPGYGSGW